MKHEIVEKNVGLMALIIVIVISFGGLAEIVPLFFLKDTTEPVEGLKPWTALQLEGRDVYIREGCHVCHTQMIRPFRAETERYGHYSLAGEFVWEHPFLWGSKRTGPDLARVGGRYSDEWHRVHLINPRIVVPESNMPSFPWLEVNVLDGSETAAKMRAMKTLGVPYSDEDINGAADAVKGKTEMDALIAYLQGLGTTIKSKR
ncbi:cytochrome-c oxidase, cbb3-type subunit II [Permianibacter aggregans]|uniref:Cytochrome c oxidase cbb3-type subunit 2 n=1 Tax=Permianibacter aggregans TaxID=1510150 RepID=A0A4R6UH76_9GAMM|nr:cytochrome-c oxidase, cbb3-type subunit II [Permianibacter aggregans]QGX41621.1 cytochrome-c oxidase, cbb3-type subunit II [Permianibacter aggregans]TDQ45692.1 cytochrome c oxidase cbb3-type subunit 2 [Permianibacter aggregans]